MPLWLRRRLQPVRRNKKIKKIFPGEPFFRRLKNGSPQISSKKTDWRETGIKKPACFSAGREISAHRSGSPRFRRLFRLPRSLPRGSPPPLTGDFSPLQESCMVWAEADDLLTSQPTSGNLILAVIPASSVPFPYPFRPCMLIPSTRLRWKKKKISRMGISERTDMANVAP